MLKPIQQVSQDPEFYFQNTDYSELRELICYERPAAFVLHYYFGFYHSRIWLFDRFDFSLNEQGELESNSNSLAGFFKSSGVIKEQTISMTSKQFGDLLSESCSDTSAVIVPYFSKVAGTEIVSSILVESAGETILTTSLRGDSFHVRQPYSREMLADRLFLQDGMINYYSLTIPDQIVKSGTLSPLNYANQINLQAMIKNILTTHHNRSKTQTVGAKALAGALFLKQSEKDQWIELANQGFSNVLLVKFFWPLQYAFQPFLVFLSSTHRDGILINLIGHQVAESLSQRIEIVKFRAKQASNFAILFGKQPGDRFYHSFIESLNFISREYAEIETEFFEALLGRHL